MNQKLLPKSDLPCSLMAMDAKKIHNTKIAAMEDRENTIFLKLKYILHRIHGLNKEIYSFLRLMERKGEKWQIGGK